MALNSSVQGLYRAGTAEYHHPPTGLLSQPHRTKTNVKSFRLRKERNHGSSELTGPNPPKALVKKFLQGSPTEQKNDHQQIFYQHIFK
jgi:hypothetical protein